MNAKIQPSRRMMKSIQEGTKTQKNQLKNIIVNHHSRTSSVNAVTIKNNTYIKTFINKQRVRKRVDPEA